jgi:nicotinate phosphoribosyltransferase
LLPDTFGTTQFLKNAPEWIRNWVGARPDSKEMFEAGEELIVSGSISASPTKTCRQAHHFLLTASTCSVRGEANGADIIDLHKHFTGGQRRLRLGHQPHQ